VNGRFLDLGFRLPDELRSLEPALRERLEAMRMLPEYEPQFVAGGVLTLQQCAALTESTLVGAALGLGAEQAYQLALNSFNASFIEPSERALHIERLQAAFESFS
jgi:hypothetical protein